MVHNSIFPILSNPLGTPRILIAHQTFMFSFWPGWTPGLRAEIHTRAPMGGWWGCWGHREWRLCRLICSTQNMPKEVEPLQQTSFFRCGRVNDWVTLVRRRIVAILKMLDQPGEPSNGPEGCGMVEKDNVFLQLKDVDDVTINSTLVHSRSVYHKLITVEESLFF